MSSTYISIDSVRDAIANHVIKGTFDEDHLLFTFEPIHYITRGKPNTYTIVIQLLNATGEILPITDEILDGEKMDEGLKASIAPKSGQDGGKIRDVTPTFILKGKNIGKKNETNVVTQAFRDALGLYNKKLAKTLSSDGTKDSTEASSTEASSKGESSTETSSKKESSKEESGMPLPMTINKDSKLIDSDFENGVILQKKHNGVRYITYRKCKDDTELENLQFCTVSYSRNGKLFSDKSMPKIKRELKILFDNSMDLCSSSKITLNKIQSILQLSDEEFEYYKGSTPYFDGELYKHGMSLQEISGQARKKQSNIDLDYYIFDVFFPMAIANGHHLTSDKRQAYLDYIFSKVEPLGFTSIKRVENYKVNNPIEVKTLFDEFLLEGYEGAIARKDHGIYEYSYSSHRSKDLIKIKPYLDDEFEIVGFTQGVAGSNVGAIIWICCAHNNKDLTFTVVPNMKTKERKDLYKKLIENELESAKYIGKKLTVSYSELSSDGIPQQPKGVVIRDYE